MECVHACIIYYILPCEPYHCYAMYKIKKGEERRATANEQEHVSAKNELEDCRSRSDKNRDDS